MVKKYSIDELADLHDQYQKIACIRYLVSGKWVYHKPDGVPTKAERVKIKDHKTFIEWLKEKA
jgi:hypothetical protein